MLVETNFRQTGADVLRHARYLGFRHKARNYHPTQREERNKPCTWDEGVMARWGREWTGRDQAGVSGRCSWLGYKHNNEFFDFGFGAWNNSDLLIR